MKLKYMFLMTFLISSCGGGESKTAPTKAVKTTQTAQVIPVASKMTPREHGAKIYKRCKACHTLDEDGKHKVGPNLWDVYGAKAGSKEGFNYSKVMAASDVIWTDETMDAYMTKPSTFMKGNRMSFIGLKKQADRDAVQLYIKSKTTP